MNLDRGAWISTFSGHPFWPLDPQAQDVRITDIAHALSNLCRFAGHTREFYSVAQHCVIVSEICSAGGGVNGLWGLLHDASEAYLNDITRPVKRMSELRGYRDLEASVQSAVCLRFGLEPVEPPIVKAVDEFVLRAEQRDLMNMPQGWRPNGITRYPTIVPMTQAAAEHAFLQCFYELTATRELSPADATDALSRAFARRRAAIEGDRQ